MREPHASFLFSPESCPKMASIAKISRWELYLFLVFWTILGISLSQQLLVFLSEYCDTFNHVTLIFPTLLLIYSWISWQDFLNFEISWLILDILAFKNIQLPDFSMLLSGITFCKTYFHKELLVYSKSLEIKKMLCFAWDGKIWGSTANFLTFPGIIWLVMIFEYNDWLLTLTKQRCEVRQMIVLCWVVSAKKYILFKLINIVHRMAQQRTQTNFHPFGVSCAKRCSPCQVTGCDTSRNHIQMNN